MLDTVPHVTIDSTKRLNPNIPDAVRLDDIDILDFDRGSALNVPTEISSDSEEEEKSPG